MNNTTPYRVKGCPYLLLELADWMGAINIGWEIEIDDINYEVTHMFHYCMAIREVK
tara:strand:+ start:1284 stop:1451 length:168 start_codon:yes stop_codon:yes gene_type:complete